MTFDKLPDEILITIFKKLGQVELCNILRVNKKFHILALDISSGLIINHDFSLTNDTDLIDQVTQIKKCFINCGTSEWTSKMAIVNRLKDHLPQEGNDVQNYDRKNKDSSRRKKSIVVNLLPQFKGVCFVHQDANFLKRLLKHMFEFCAAIESIAFVDINLSDDHMKYIPGRILREIHDIRIIGCERITNDSLKHIGIYSNKLINLNLEDCFHVSDEGLLHILKSCTDIKSLDLSGTCVTNIGMCSISVYCRYLKSLKVARCRKLTGEGFGGTTEDFRYLEYLDISSNYEGITDKGIQILVRKCISLTYLDISNSSNITDISILTIADCCPKLQEFLAKGCIRITQEGLIYLVRKNNNLMTLNIDEISITNHLLFAIANNCPNLIKLSINKYLNIKEGIKYIHLKCPKLQIFPDNYYYDIF